MQEINIREKMFAAMREKTLFRQAQNDAFEYADQIFDRNVYPTAAALAGLKFFDEALPNQPCAGETM